MAAKANDLEAIKKAVEDAASVGAPLWLSYLFLLFYVALAASGVKHADLLLENPVELPFLNIKLPLIAFFVIAPILFVIVHAYVMAHFALLSDKAKLFHTELKRQEKSHSVREGLRRQLPINLFAQFLAGPVEIREGLFSVLLWAVAWISLVAGPLLVLLLLHVQFLPYHDSRVSWVHRGALIFDLVIIWWLWMKILSGRSGPDSGEQAPVGRWAKLWNSVLWWSRNIVAWPLTGLIVAFSVLVATFPGEWRQWPYSLVPALGPWATAATEAIFGKVDPLNKSLTGSWPVNTLRLKEFDIYEALKVEDRKTFEQKEHSYILHDRHLEQAELRFARLGKVDLRDAHLEGALLDLAQLQGATLESAQLQDASLEGAQLQSASLKGAELQGARLILAQLQGATLESAQLQDASLVWAQLQGATLDEAQLQGASLDEAQLQGASLDGAQLQGALLDGAQLQGASLVRLRAWRADLGKLEPESVALIRIDGIDWSPAWGALGGTHQRHDQAYDDFRKTLEKIPQGDMREKALKRVERLDCEKTGESLASCDPKAKGPHVVHAWRRTLEAGRVPNQAAYWSALAAIFSDLLCGGDADAIHVLRGLIKYRRLAEVGGEAAKLIAKILDDQDHCRVSAALTAKDKAELLEINKKIALVLRIIEESAKPEVAPLPVPSAPEKKPKR
jgi:uncharacterized protein YjbI with pentapeptide repeats